MFDINQITLVGRLGADPELRTTKTGKSVATFSVATDRPIRTEQGWDRITEWHRCVAWEKKAEWVAAQLKKGDPAAISGSVRYSSWTDDSGNKRYKTEVHADTVSFMSRRSGRVAPPEANRGANTEAPMAHERDEPPF